MSILGVRSTHDRIPLQLRHTTSAHDDDIDVLLLGDFADLVQFMKETVQRVAREQFQRIS